MKSYFVYMLRCSDDSFYIGITNDVDRRVNEHNFGLDRGSYTHERRPVRLVYASEFANVDDAIAWEKRIKGWSRPKKAALARGDWSAIRELAKRGVKPSALVAGDTPVCDRLQP